MRRGGDGIGAGAVDGDSAIGDKDVHVARSEPHRKGGADGAHRDLACHDDEGAGGVVGDFKVSLAAHDGDATDRGRKFDEHPGIAIELDLRAVGETLAGGLRDGRTGGECGGWGEGRGAKPRRAGDHEQGERGDGRGGAAT